MSGLLAWQTTLSAAEPPAQPADAKPADAKPQEAKPQEKPPEAKPPTPPAEAKPEPKPPEAKPPEEKPEEKPPEAKPQAKSPEAKPEEKPPEAKAPAPPAEAKPEPKPAEAKPPEPKPRAVRVRDSRGQEVSYTLLAHPSVAERLKLTEQQRAKVAELVAERSAALAKAAEPDRAKTIDASEEKLAGVLTDEQLADWVKAPPEPLLRFNYRFQRWVDVLEEVAKQAGLSLVLEAPPPGTFNYSDAREYTPTEAIDLLNGVLVTKGFTLVRRDKMLVLIDLAEGIPEGLIPRVTIEELGNRGKFEMVTVLFPLKGRAAATVTEEIKPLLGPHGKIVPLPATGQLLITDTAGIMKALSAVIESMPVPPASPAPKPAESPVAAVYPIKIADPPTALKVLQTLLPGATFALDPKTDQIHAHATPSQQATIKTVLEQIQASAPADKKPKLETYPLDAYAAEQLMKTLTAIVPEAKLSQDPQTGRLVAWATPAEQETIRGIVEKLGGAGADRVRQFEVYRLTKAEPGAAVALLQELFPQAKVAADKQTGNLVVIGTPGDQMAIKGVLEQLQPDKPGPATPELKAYPVTTADPSSALATLKGLYPNAQIVLDEKTGRLLVTASAADQAAIKASLDQIQAPLPAEKQPRFESYLLRGLDPAALVANLQTLVPGAKVTVDASAGKLVVFATPGDHEVVKGALEKLGRGTSPENTPQVEVYPLTKADPTTLLATLQPLVPEAKLTVDPQTKNLVAIAVPADQKAIKAILEQLQPEKPGPATPELRAYPVATADPSSALATLKGLYPNAQIVLDAKTEQFLVTAAAADQAAIKATLDQIQAPLPAERRPRFESYLLHGVDPSALSAQLQTLAPNAKIAVDAAARKLVVFGTPAEHEAVRGALEKLGRGTSLENTPQIEVYRLTKADPTTLLATLQPLVPDAKLAVDPQTKNLVAVAVPSDQKAIKALLEQLDPDKVAAEKQPRLEVYPVHGTDPAGLVAQLQELAPNAKITADAKTSKLVVWGTPAEHETLKAALDKLGRGPGLAGTPQLEVYRLTKADPATIVATLQGVAPEAKITLDAQTKTLVVLAVPADQKAIRNVLEQLQPDAPAPDAPQLRFYPLSQAPPASMLGVLQALAPKAQVTFDASSRRLTVVATPEDHNVLNSAIEQVEKTLQLEEKHKLVTYAVTPAQRKRFQAVSATLTNELPGVQVMAESEPGELVIWARPSQHAVIAELIEQLKRDAPAAEKYQIAAYSIKAGDPKSVLALLEKLFPDAQFTLDARTRRVIVYASPADLEAIRAAIEKIDAGRPGDTQEKLMVYPVRDIDLATATKTLQEALPDVRLASDPKANTLLAWAMPWEHDQIEQLLKQMQGGAELQLRPRLVVYPVAEGDPASMLAVLRALVPSAQVAVDPKTHSIAATASPPDHVLIASAIEQMSRKEPPERAYKIVVYALASASPTAASTAAVFLRSMFPEAQFSPGAEPDKLVVWARPKDHEAIKNTIEQLSAQDPPERAHRLATYTLDAGRRGALSSILAILGEQFPGARFMSGLERGHILAWARPDDHKKIAATLEELNKNTPPPEIGYQLVIYTLESGGSTAVNNALGILRSMFPDAFLSAGSAPGKLLAWARPKDHPRIETIVKQVGKAEPPETAPRIEVYELRAAGGSRGSGGAAGAISVLKTMFPDVQISPGTDPRKLVAYARPPEHEKIKAALAVLDKEEPPETAPRVVVYTLESAGAAGVTGAISVLQTLFPGVQFTAGAEPGKLVALARPDEHKAIHTTINEMAKKEPPETAPRLAVYPMKSASVTAGYYTIVLLRSMFPDAQFSVGSETDKLVVWARPKDHEGIKKAVEQLSQQDPPETARKMTVYTLETVGPGGAAAVVSTLTAMFPDAKFTAGAEPDKIIAWARPDDHKLIAAAVAEMSKKEPPEKARQLATYTLDSGGPYGFSYALTTLRAAFPDAQFSVGADPNRLVAWARPAEHAQIQKAVEELSRREPPEKAPSVATYDLTAIDAATATTLLRTAFPEAQFSVGADPTTLIVWARPADQALIKKTIAEIEAGGGPHDKRVLAVYPFKANDVTALAQLLDPTVRRGVQLVPDAPRGRLLVWADPKHQDAIKAVIDQFAKETAKAGEPTSQVYRFQWADPQAAYSVLATLVPSAQIALDAASRSLVVNAMPEDHAKIKATIDEMDRRDPEGQSPRLEVHRLEHADAESLMTVLRGLFRLQPQVQLSVDERRGAIVALATPVQQETIRSLVEQVEKEAAADATVSLEVYPLGDADSRATLRLLTSLLEKQGTKAEVSIEPRTNSLVVIARPEQHKAVKAALEQIKPEERSLEILQLDVVDPTTAELAIGRLFGDDAYGAHAPTVDSDFATQQLFVRATKAQHEKIRDLLVKMGETGLVPVVGVGLHSRVVPFDGDLNAAVEEIQRVWPQLRANPIRVVSPPPDVLIRPRPSSTTPEPGKSPIRPAAGPEESAGKPLPTNEILPPESAKKPAPAPAPSPPTPLPASGAKGAQGAKPAPSKPTPPDAAKPAPGDPAKPVLVVPGEGTVSISSEDPAALSQFEQLLRALSRQRGVVGRNYTVFLLRHAKASSVAATLQQVFRAMPAPYRSYGSVVVVPDDRLNAIVAYANRTDRTTIESLLKVLDTDEMPESLAADRLQLIPIKNTGAEKIVETLSAMFRSHVDSFSVEETTNSVVVVASPQTVEEVKRVAATLDEAAGKESARSVEIVSLRKTKSERVEQALEVLLKNRPRRRSR